VGHRRACQEYYSTIALFLTYRETCYIYCAALIEMRELRSLAMANSVVSILAQMHREEEGQGMVEYVLILALVALAATAGMTTLATAINSAFTKIGSLLSSYV